MMEPTIAAKLSLSVKLSSNKRGFDCLQGLQSREIRLLRFKKWLRFDALASYHR